MSDRLHGRLEGRCDFILASKQGQVTAFCFQPHGHPSWWSWQTLSYPVNDELSFPGWSPHQPDSVFGFRVIGDQIYPVMRSTQTGPDGRAISVFGAAFASLRGSGIVLPYWFLFAITMAVGFLLARRHVTRFGVGTVLIAMTLVAVTFGIARAIDY